MGWCTVIGDDERRCDDGMTGMVSGLTMDNGSSYGWLGGCRVVMCNDAMSRLGYANGSGGAGWQQLQICSSCRPTAAGQASLLAMGVAGAR